MFLLLNTFHEETDKDHTTGLKQRERERTWIEYEMTLSNSCMSNFTPASLSLLICPRLRSPVSCCCLAVLVLSSPLFLAALCCLVSILVTIMTANAIPHPPAVTKFPWNDSVTGSKQPGKSTYQFLASALASRLRVEWDRQGNTRHNNNTTTTNQNKRKEKEIDRTEQKRTQNNTSHRQHRNKPTSDDRTDEECSRQAMQAHK